MPNLELDAIDRRIISTLQENGRLSNVELADSVGLGLTVFIGVKIEGHANDKAEAFQEAVIAMPETISCHLIAGDIDYLIEVVVPDLDHYQRYLVEKLLNLP